MTRRRTRTVLVLSVCAAALALAGCGGGGGTARPNPISSPPPPPPPPPSPPPPSPPPTNFDDAEYRRSNGAVSSGAIAAWQDGATGRNVKVGVIDTGVNPNLAEFTGRIDPASQDVAANRGVTDEEGHGTAVTAVIAANRNGSGIVGVAFESTIISLNTADPTDCDPDDGCTHRDGDIARAIDIARNNGARVVNISLGGDGVGQSVIDAVARAVQAGMVIVVSAGNESDADPDPFAAQIAARASGRQVIIAGAVDSRGDIASFSNRAGASANFYLAALGVSVRAPDQTGASFLWSGTSFSAPIISGAAALLASAFPNLTGAEIAELLLSTADDAGVPGVDATFGHGILNIRRAFEPQGTVTLAGSRIAITDLGGGELSGPMGDARPRMAGVVFLDGFSRAYVADIAQRLAAAPQQRPLEQRLRQDVSTAVTRIGPTLVSLSVRGGGIVPMPASFARTGLSMDEARAARALASHVLSRIGPRTAIAFGISESGRTLQRRLQQAETLPFLVARDPMERAGFYTDGGASFGIRHDLGGIGLTLTGERGEVEQFALREGLPAPTYRLAALTLDRRFGPAFLTLGATRLDETETVLGGRFSLAPGGATSWFLDGTARVELGAGWRTGARWRRGWTRMPGGNGLVSGGYLRTDTWSFDLARGDAFRRGDELALRVMQPLRVRSGGYALDVPVSYDYATLGVGYERRMFSLAPTGREINVEAAYRIGLFGDRATLTANAYYRRQPGHVAAMPGDYGLALRLAFGSEGSAP